MVPWPITCSYYSHRYLSWLNCSQKLQLVTCTNASQAYHHECHNWDIVLQGLWGVEFIHHPMAQQYQAITHWQCYVITSHISHCRVLSRTPLGRVGEAEEIGEVAAFLASKESSYITGEVLSFFHYMVKVHRTPWLWGYNFFNWLYNQSICQCVRLWSELFTYSSLQLVLHSACVFIQYGSIKWHAYAVQYHIDSRMEVDKNWACMSCSMSDVTLRCIHGALYCQKLAQVVRCVCGDSASPSTEQKYGTGFCRYGYNQMLCHLQVKSSMRMVDAWHSITQCNKMFVAPPS
jgi:hypothetical protein